MPLFSMIYDVLLNLSLLWPSGPEGQGPKVIKFRIESSKGPLFGNLSSNGEIFRQFDEFPNINNRDFVHQNHV